MNKTTFKQFLSEGRYATGTTWTLLPATRVLFNKNKVAIEEIAKQWDEGCVLICSSKKWGKEATIAFLFTSGGCSGHHIGEEKTGVHDQSQADLGQFKIVNIAIIQKGKIVGSENQSHINDKAPVLVFK